MRNVLISLRSGLLGRSAGGAETPTPPSKMLKFSVALVAALALVGPGANAQFCSDCKWGVNKVVSYVEQNGNNDVCSAVLSEVQSYTMDLCNSLDGCSSYVTNMCNQVLQQIESDAGSALAADNIDATAICTDVGACESTASSSASDDDDSGRVRKSAGSSWANSFCSNECQAYPNPSECIPACVRDVSASAQQLKQAINVKMLEDERKSPTITLSTGEAGHCVRDMETNHFLCSVNHRQASLAAQPSSSSSPNSKDSSTLSTGTIAGIAVGAVAAVAIIAFVGFKARSENKKLPTGSSSVLLVQDDAEYATA